MENRLILLDSSVLIQYFRKVKKEETFFWYLANQNYSFGVSTITKFEIYVGSKKEHLPYWNTIFSNFQLFSVDNHCIQAALDINEKLKKKSIQIGFPDLLIGATAFALQLPIATLNVAHFNRIENLEIITEIKI